ncbi:MAG: carbohydrate kinase family protein [Phycisphaerales bacterium]|nr:MAG: carbohydrate kinase family protein [Phycisphaerales bacterium]
MTVREEAASAVVAGHICLDVIPAIEAGGERARNRFAPGSLVEIASTVISTGGAVSNTGLALHRLAIPTRLVGKVGDDLFGRAILQILGEYGPSLAGGIATDPSVSSSYTLVISPPGVDRFFLHYPGANATFVAADVPFDDLAGAGLFHFGYPPAMRGMYVNDGEETVKMFREAAQRGMITSLDMCMPDVESEAGGMDWRRVLRRVLPHVDLFLPNLQEIGFMLGGRGRRAGGCGVELCSELADELLAMGAAVVGLKLGEEGMYLRTTADSDRLSGLTSVTGPTFLSWVGREIHSTRFEVEAAGTTGCGDAAVAGLIAGLLRGLTIEKALTMAVAVGACCAEAADAISGLRPWGEMRQRIDAGWNRRPAPVDWPGWTHDASAGLSRGPNDAQRRQTGADGHGRIER